MLAQKLADSFSYIQVPRICSVARNRDFALAVIADYGLFTVANSACCPMLCGVHGISDVLSDSEYVPAFLVFKVHGVHTLFHDENTHSAYRSVLYGKRCIGIGFGKRVIRHSVIYEGYLDSKKFLKHLNAHSRIATYVKPGDGAYDSEASTADDSSENKSNPDTGFACVAAPLLAGGVLTAALTRKRR